MKFLNPAGFWILCGIPILIIIYLIKTPHEDRAVSSTYIWQLSKEFSKKKLPLQRFKKILLFLLQLLIIITSAFLAARPYLYDGEITDYIVIVDASASMRIENAEGISRYDRALGSISELEKELGNGHTISIIHAGETPSCVLQNATSATALQRSLNNISCGRSACDIAEALKLAQTLCDQSKNPQVLFFTDTDYSYAKNVTVLNMNELEWNATVTSLSYEIKEGDTVFTGTIVSSKTTTLVLGLQIDDKIISAKKTECLEGQETTITFTVEGLLRFDYAMLYFEGDDGLQEDNAYAVCPGESYVRKVLLVSDSPLYIQSALKALGNCEVTTISKIEDEQLSGYSLYLFDGIYPEYYPTDGSVIQFGTGKLPDGLSVGEEMEEVSEITANFPDDTGICAGITFDDAVLSKYSALRGNASWSPLFYCKDVSVAMTEKLSRGRSMTVFSFDLHDSNLPMKMDYPLLMKNLINHAVPNILEKTDYVVGETVSIYTLPAAERLYVKAPDGTLTALSIDQIENIITPDITGIYTVVQTIGEGGEYTDFFLHLSLEELKDIPGDALFVAMPNTPAEDAVDAIKELRFYFAIALLLLILTEWGVYYHDRY